MSRFISGATAQGAVVKVGSVEIPNTTHMGQALGASTGTLVLDDGSPFYFPKTQPDLDTTLGKLNDALQALVDGLTQIGTTLTAIGAGMTGPSTAPPPTLATGVATIISKATAITAIKADLTALKGALR